MNKIIKSKLKGILFDKDGTLIAFESFWFEVILEVFESLRALY